MDKNELKEYADMLMQAAVRKCDDLADAQAFQCRKGGIYMSCAKNTTT